jgi:hypothetical protein
MPSALLATPLSQGFAMVKSASRLPQPLSPVPPATDEQRPSGARAAAIVPVWATGELRGIPGLAWEEPRIFDEDERAFVVTLGVMCAQAIPGADEGAA